MIEVFGNLVFPLKLARVGVLGVFCIALVSGAGDIPSDEVAKQAVANAYSRKADVIAFKRENGWYEPTSPGQSIYVVQFTAIVASKDRSCNIDTETLYKKDPFTPIPLGIFEPRDTPERAPFLFSAESCDYYFSRVPEAVKMLPVGTEAEVRGVVYLMKTEKGWRPTGETKIHSFRLSPPPVLNPPTVTITLKPDGSGSISATAECTGVFCHHYLRGDSPAILRGTGKLSTSISQRVKDKRVLVHEEKVEFQRLGDLQQFEWWPKWFSIQYPTASSAITQRAQLQISAMWETFWESYYETPILDLFSEMAMSMLAREGFQLRKEVLVVKFVLPGAVVEATPIRSQSLFPGLNDRKWEVPAAVERSNIVTYELPFAMFGHTNFVEFSLTISDPQLGRAFSSLRSVFATSLEYLREAGLKLAALGNARIIQLALERYAVDTGGSYPVCCLGVYRNRSQYYDPLLGFEYLTVYPRLLSTEPMKNVPVEAPSLGDFSYLPVFLDTFIALDSTKVNPGPPGSFGWMYVCDFDTDGDTSAASDESQPWCANQLIGGDLILADAVTTYALIIYGDMDYRDPVSGLWGVYGILFPDDSDSFWTEQKKKALYNLLAHKMRQRNTVGHNG
jgi:hypothetical protein